MKKLLRPDYYVTSIYKIKFEVLRKKGINNIIIDIDNTLMPMGSEVADEGVMELIRKLKAQGFKVCILSNRSKRRVRRFVGKAGVQYYSFGRKPMLLTFYGALRKLGARPDNTCIIGDQIFTDILGGNRAGLYTILVDPILKQNVAATILIRKIEANIRKKLKYAKELITSQ